MTTLSAANLQALDAQTSGGGGIDDDTGLVGDPQQQQRSGESEPQSNSKCLAFCPTAVRVFFTKNAEFLSIARSAAIIQFLRNISVTLGMLLAGRSLSGEALAGVGIGYSWMNAFAIAFVMGVTSVIDTFAPQMHGRSPHSPVLGVYLRTALLVGAAACLLYVIATWAFVNVFLERVLHVDAAYRASAIDFLKPSVLVAAGTGAGSALNKFFNAQKRASLAIVGYLVGVTVFLVVALFVVDITTPFGISLAIGIGRVAAPVAMFISGSYDADIARSWSLQHPHDLAASLDPSLLRNYVALAVPSVVSNVADRWVFEVVSMMLAAKYGHGGDALPSSPPLVGMTVPPTAVAATTTTSTSAATASPLSDNGSAEIAAFSLLTTIWIFCFPLGVASYVAGNSLLGSALGAGDAAAAQHVFRQTLRLAAYSCLFVAVLAVLLGPLLVNVMVQDDHVRRKMKAVLVLYIGMCFSADAMQFVGQGLLRAMNCDVLRTVTFAARSIVISQYAVGVFCVWLLAIHFDLGLVGVGVGLFLGNAANAVAQIVFIERYVPDWRVLAHAISSHAAAEDALAGMSPSDEDDGVDLRTTTKNSAMRPSNVPPLDLTNAKRLADEADRRDHGDEAGEDDEELDALEAARNSQRDDDDKAAPAASRGDTRHALSWEDE